MDDIAAVRVNPILATIDIDPDNLNLKAKGKWATCYIEFPEDYDVRLINIGTPENPLVFLEGVIPAETDPKYGFVTDPDEYLTNHDEDWILERMVKFDRQALAELLSQGTSGLTTLIVTGEIIAFEGSDTINVKDGGSSTTSSSSTIGKGGK